MNESYKKKMIQRYEERYRQFGRSPQTLGWGKGGRQEIRFSILTDPILSLPDTHVLDIGCGFADLYDFLIVQGWRGQYTGVEVVPSLIREAHKKHSQLEIIEADFLEWETGDKQYDAVVASGIFNAKDDPDMNLCIHSTLKKMLAVCRIYAAADFMSTNVDYQHEIAHHSDPRQMLDLGFSLTRRVQLRHDYMPYEFSLFLFKDDSINQRNIFASYDDSSGTTGSTMK